MEKEINLDFLIQNFKNHNLKKTAFQWKYPKLRSQREGNKERATVKLCINKIQKIRKKLK